MGPNLRDRRREGEGSKDTEGGKEGGGEGDQGPHGWVKGEKEWRSQQHAHITTTTNYSTGATRKLKGLNKVFMRLISEQQDQVRPKPRPRLRPRPRLKPRPRPRPRPVLRSLHILSIWSWPEHSLVLTMISSFSRASLSQRISKKPSKLLVLQHYYYCTPFFKCSEMHLF